jgi:uncharacterized protein (TIGR03085 family)
VTTWAQQERVALADVLEQLGPDAPTLCDGWTTKELAAHVYVREHRPDASLGVLPLGPLSAYTDRVMRGTLRTMGYDEIVRRLRTAPPWLRLGNVDALINTAEFFIHTEDARRPNNLPLRELPADFERAIWRRGSKQARISFRRVDARVRLIPTVGDPVEVGSGELVEIRGLPSELLLLEFNRKDAARVDMTGATTAVDKVRNAKLGL